MLRYADAEKLTIDDKPLFEKYILSWLHLGGFDLPSIGKCLIQHHSASAKFSHRIIFRSELLSLLGYIENNEQKSDNRADDDLHLLQYLHTLGLTLFDLKYSFNIDFDICQADNNENGRVSVDGAPESDPTYIAQTLWNDLEQQIITAVKTKSDLWKEKRDVHVELYWFS